MRRLPNIVLWDRGPNSSSASLGLRLLASELDLMGNEGGWFLWSLRPSWPVSMSLVGSRVGDTDLELLWSDIFQKK